MVIRADGDGHWATTLPVDLPDGTYRVTARARRDGHPRGPAVSQVMTWPSNEMAACRRLLPVSEPAGLALDFLSGTALQKGGASYFGPLSGLPGLSFSRASSAYRTNASGVMESVASGVLRFDHDPVTFAPKGALIEGARTNLIKNNSMQGASAGTRPTGWVAPFTNATGITITSAGAGVETGIDYSDWDITGTASVDGTVFLYCWGAASDIPASPGQVYGGSLFCKIAAGSLAGTTWVGGVNGIFMTPYNSSLTSIAGGQSTAFTPTTAPLSQCRFTTESWTTPASTAYVGMYVRFQITAGVPVNLRLRIGWPQIEQGATASSPVRTTTAAATRAADLLSMPSPGLVGATEGTMVAEGKTSARAIVGNNGLIQLDDGTSANRITLYQLGGADRRMALYIASGGVASVNQAIGTTIPLGSVVRAALTWSGGSVLVSINGGTPISFTGVTIPSVTTCRIGGGGTPGSVPWWDVVSKSALLPRTFSSAELQALTA